MPKRQTALPSIWPKVWLVSDARNDAVLEQVLSSLPCGSGLIYRHYHLEPGARRARFDSLARIARRRGHLIALSGSARQARAWGADAAYGSASALVCGASVLRLATVHSLRELRRAARSDAVILSPAFATRSHPQASPLGSVRFRLLAARAKAPVIALGGMNSRRAHRLGCASWAAIDGLIP